MGRQSQTRDRRHRLGQERPLNVGDDVELALDKAVGLPQLLGQHEVLRRPAEEVAEPDPLREPCVVEGRGLVPHADDHVRGHALVEQGDGHQRTRTGEVLVRGVVRGDLKVVDDAGLIAVNQFAQKASVESGELVFLLPGVDVARPTCSTARSDTAGA